MTHECLTEDRGEKFRRMRIAAIICPSTRISVIQPFLDMHPDIARDPNVRAAMREKKGRPPVAPPQA
jgi:hypothetical protein